MADRFHVPGQTNLNSTAAWATARGGSGGASIPITGDNAFIYDLVDTIATGLPNTVDLERCVIVGAGGSIPSGIQFTVSNSADSAMEVSGTFSSLFIESHSGQAIDYLRLYDVVGTVPQLATGTATTIEGGRTGSALLGASMVCTNLLSAGMGFEIQDNATAITSLLTAGRVDCSRDITAGDVVFGGRLRLLDDVNIGQAGVSTGRVFVHGGAVLIWNSIGTINKVEALPGSILSAAGATSLIELDETSSLPDLALRKWAGARVFEDSKVDIVGTSGATLSAVTYPIGYRKVA